MNVRIQCGEPDNPMPAPHARTMPLPVLAPCRDWTLHDAAASRAAEAAAAATLPANALMARAGLATARLAMAVAPHAASIDVCCGPGNNGGDGLVAAVHLLQAGRRVRAVLLGDADRLPPDAAHALQLAREAGVPIDTTLPTRLDAGLLIDALLGMGARGLDDGVLADAARSINAGRSPVLAVDLPSGLDGDTGHVAGRVAVHATHTLSLLSLKPGLFTGRGREHAGRVWVDDLGASPDPAAACARLPGPGVLRTLLPPRGHAQHKGSYGNVVVLGGAPGMVGAALLAGHAALACGAGRVYVAALAEGLTLDPSRPELMLRTVAAVLKPDVLADATVVCGCGGGDELRAWLPVVLHHAARLVLDADGLNAVATDGGLHRALHERARRGRGSVLTPHPLEAARLLGVGVADVQADRMRAARSLADACAAVVALKGSGTVIAAPGTLLCINPTGNARLATAGTGDVLAGWIGGLWSQQCLTDPTGHGAASASVWLHGAAADTQAGSGPLLAADLIGAMSAAAHALRAETV